jgi:hypothetical protein
MYLIAEKNTVELTLIHLMLAWTPVDDFLYY